MSLHIARVLLLVSHIIGPGTDHQGTTLLTNLREVLNHFDKNLLILPTESQATRMLLLRHRGDRGQNSIPVQLDHSKRLTKLLANT